MLVPVRALYASRCQQGVHFALVCFPEWPAWPLLLPGPWAATAGAARINHGTRFIEWLLLSSRLLLPMPPALLLLLPQRLQHFLLLPAGKLP
jgi:hypothetical protein